MPHHSFSQKHTLPDNSARNHHNFRADPETCLVHDTWLPSRFRLAAVRCSDPSVGQDDDCAEQQGAHCMLHVLLWNMLRYTTLWLYLLPFHILLLLDMTRTTTIHYSVAVASYPISYIWYPLSYHISSYKLWSIHYVLYALCSMLYALCSTPYALCSMLYPLCSILYDLCSRPYSLCSMLHTMCSIPCAIDSIPCATYPIL